MMKLTTKRYDSDGNLKESEIKVIDGTTFGYWLFHPDRGKIQRKEDGSYVVVDISIDF